ncbi:hypothetical protein PR002_g22944 [Phytophthora rubi]|uniref:Crinkler effector protein N-terminal domain-containing protein n=1 Tax=Phytophthora rubi TaxID=129364 RepID=A0A6A3IU85_9STRA|nr:hypothetical protein PR002_g22944 [Phytophthora rubi]
MSVGEPGTASGVKIDDSAQVWELKEAIAPKLPDRLKCTPAGLRLFLGKSVDGAWLESDSEDVKKLKEGEKTVALEALTSKKKELQGEFGLQDVLTVCLLSLEKALDQIDQVALEALLPVVLLLNYTLLIYLAVFYWKRRRERRVMLLLCVGTLGTVAIIPFARPDQSFVEAVNDISEACCVLTFLLQITIIGYDLNKRFKMRSVMFFTYAAEVLILADLVSILLSCVVVLNPSVIS